MHSLSFSHTHTGHSELVVHVSLKCLHVSEMPFLVRQLFLLLFLLFLLLPTIPRRLRSLTPPHSPSACSRDGVCLFVAVCACVCVCVYHHKIQLKRNAHNQTTDQIKCQTSNLLCMLLRGAAMGVAACGR